MRAKLASVIAAALPVSDAAHLHQLSAPHRPMDGIAVPRAAVLRFERGRANQMACEHPSNQGSYLFRGASSLPQSSPAALSLHASSPSAETRTKQAALSGAGRTATTTTSPERTPSKTTSRFTARRTEPAKPSCMPMLRLPETNGTLFELNSAGRALQTFSTANGISKPTIAVFRPQAWLGFGLRPTVKRSSQTSKLPKSKNVHEQPKKPHAKPRLHIF